MKTKPTRKGPARDVTLQSTGPKQITSSPSIDPEGSRLLPRCARNTRSVAYLDELGLDDHGVHHHGLDRGVARVGGHLPDLVHHVHAGGDLAMDRVPGSLEVLSISSSGMLPPASLVMVFPLQVKELPPGGLPVPALRDLGSLAWGQPNWSINLRCGTAGARVSFGESGPRRGRGGEETKGGVSRRSATTQLSCRTVGIGRTRRSRGGSGRRCRIRCWPGR